MAEQQPPKDESFFRKVVRFVANPATDWADLNSRQDDGGELDLLWQDDGQVLMTGPATTAFEGRFDAALLGG